MASSYPHLMNDELKQQARARISSTLLGGYTFSTEDRVVTAREHLSQVANYLLPFLVQTTIVSLSVTSISIYVLGLLLILGYQVPRRLLALYRDRQVQLDDT